MGYIMYKGQSIDCSYFLGKDSSSVHLGIPKKDAPKSSLNAYETGRLPILWYNSEYKEKYYISCTRENEDDIPIGILLARCDLAMLNKKEGYLFDDKFTFISINYLDSNNINGSNSPVSNIPYGNIDPKWEWDYLRGFQPGTIPTKQQVPDPSKYDLYLHRTDTLPEAIDNTEKLWKYYDEINSDWKQDDAFNTYAKSCYLYSTPGTKQGDWKMMDYNYSYYIHDSFCYQCFLYSSREYLGVDVGGISGLTAFVYLDFHAHEDYIPHVIGAMEGDNFAGFSDARVCEAELTLPANLFKFKNE